jgi:hypothetical protein
VLKISESFGASVIVPFSLIETPRASPFKTSARVLTDQIAGSPARAKTENVKTKAAKKAAKKNIFSFVRCCVFRFVIYQYKHKNRQKDTTNKTFKWFSVKKSALSILFVNQIKKREMTY